jgi:general secretion pathway protein L
MSTQTSPFELFGFDVRELGRQFAASWRAVAKTRLLAWLTPVLPVRVLRADGSVVLWKGRLLGAAKGAETAEFGSVEIPEELVLRKLQRMPGLPDAAIAQAVELEVRATSPFTMDDTVWGARALLDKASGKNLVEVTLASRRQIARYLDERQSDVGLRSGRKAEVWVFATDGNPIIVRGWGEQSRAQEVVRQRRVAFAFVFFAMVILGLMAITPSLQLRARSLDAIAAYESMQLETKQAAVQREAFTHSVERLEVVRGVLTERIDLLQLMTVLTKVLPDDTYLQNMQTQGLKVSIQGLTGNAATLMQTLGSVPGFREVRAPTAATRALAPNAENFRIEIQLDPAVFSVAVNPASADPPAQLSPVPPSVTPPSVSSVSNDSVGGATTAPANAETPRKSRFTR